MKKICFLLLVFCHLSICLLGQKITLLNAMQGNTTHRGMIPSEDMQTEQPEGYDFYNLRLQSDKNTLIKPEKLWVKDQYVLTFSPAKTEKVTANEPFFWRFEAKKVQKYAKAPLKTEGAGWLQYSIKGKKKWITIERFKEILPN